MIINGQKINVPDAWQEASLLTFLRDYLGLMGTKYGCGKGLCGACTVHINGQPVRSCQLPIESLADRSITTIEALGQKNSLHPVQQAWKELNVPQCGYCQSGQMMTAAAFLKQNPDPSETEVIAAMQGNLCRCGTYTRINKAVLKAAALQKFQKEEEHDLD